MSRWNSFTWDELRILDEALSSWTSTYPNVESFRAVCDRLQQEVEDKLWEDDADNPENKVPGATHYCPVRAAKDFAKAYGYKGCKGGWVRRREDNKPMAHGWEEFARLCIRRKWIAVDQALGGVATYIVPGTKEDE